MSQLTLALSKGRIFEETLPLLAAALDPLSGLFAGSALLLVVVALVDRVTGHWTRRRAPAAAASSRLQTSLLVVSTSASAPALATGTPLRIAIRVRPDA